LKVYKNRPNILDMPFHKILQNSKPRKLIITRSDKLYGVNDSNDQVILHPIFEELSIFVYKGGELDNMYKTKANVAERIQQNLEQNKNKNKTKTDDSAPGLYVEFPNEVVFLTRVKEEFHLFRLCINRTIDKIGVLDIYEEYKSIEAFKLSYFEGKRKYNIDNYIDSTNLGKFYSEIIYIGKGLFKVKIIDVYELNQPDQVEEFYTSNAFYDSYTWKIINYKGQSISDISFSEVDFFNNNLCKVNRGSKWNFINNKGEFQLSVSYIHLEYPELNENMFLAGWRSYFISIGQEEGPFMFRTTDFVTNDDIDKPSYSLVNKIEKSQLSEEDLQSLFKIMYADETHRVSVNEVVRLDLYNREGLVKRIGVNDLHPLSDKLFVAEVNSIFLIDIENLENQKIFRHTDNSIVQVWLSYDFSFPQKRLVDKHGNFIGENYYHEIFDFNEKGVAKVSKSYFVFTSENNVRYMDTSLNEAYFKGDISFWRNFADFRDVAKLRWGYIDLEGNEISEFVDDEPFV